MQQEAVRERHDAFWKPIPLVATVKFCYESKPLKIHFWPTCPDLQIMQYQEIPIAYLCIMRLLYHHKKLPEQQFGGKAPGCTLLFNVEAFLCIV